MTPTTYGRDFAYCLKSHGGVRGFNASLWQFLLRCTLFCHSVATFLTSVSSYEGGCGFEAIYILSWMMHRHYMFKFGIQMPLGTPVKGGLSFNHFSCIIINGATQIGHNCTIFHGVTTALKMGGSNAGVPSIGNNCVLGPGSKILGSVTLGDNIFVGANAVVTHDMPSNSIVAGIPAKVINMNGAETTKLIRLHK